MARIFNANNLSQVDRGDRLADIHALISAIKNSNCLTSAYNITASGTNQPTAIQLLDVLNEIDSANSGTGVQLPSSYGKSSTPFQLCIIVNNTANSVKVYSQYNSGDFINNTSGATGVSLAANTNSLYVSARNGYWFSITGGSGGAAAGTGQTIIVSSSFSISPSILMNNVNLITPSAVAVSVNPATLTLWTRYEVKDAAGNAGAYNITITPTTGTFDGQSTFTIFQNYGKVIFYSDGTNLWT